MNWNDVSAILTALPNTFKRVGGNFDIWQATQTAALARMTDGYDSTTQQTSYVNSSGSWLDAWGALFGIPRRTEVDAIYRLCITGVLTATRGTPVGIEWFMNIARQIPSSVVENFPAVGWELLLSPGFVLSPTQISELPGYLNYVRPAGIPYTVVGVIGSGTLSTGNFLGRTRFLGSWLRSANDTIPINVPTSTNNTLCTLPTDLFTDPTINPSLSS